MKIEETADGTVRVVELDPTKRYWLILDADSGIRPESIKYVDGLILIKRPGTEITFIENADRIEVPT